MVDFIEKNYRSIAIVFVIAIAVFSYLIGRNEGARSLQGQVTLQCDDQVLAALTIPNPNATSGIATTPESTQTASVVPITSSTASQGQFMGSKNGTKYYTPGCAGAKRIKPENIIWFQDAADAQLQGYSAASC